MDPLPRWIDTHCHLDAPEFAGDAEAVRARAAGRGVAVCVVPAVDVTAFDAVRALAHAHSDVYALGIHPMYVSAAAPDALAQLDVALAEHRDDPRLVAVGEIGLDYFVPDLTVDAQRARQEYFYREQLRLARRYDLPVILHVRRSVDQVLKGLRDIGVPGGIAHAFNGSRQQADAFADLGFKLGFGGAVTYARATRLRGLAAELPLDTMVLETDAPDIPPQWLYATATQRSGGQPQGRNEPGELPRIGATVADLRSMTPQALAEATTRNAIAALPRLRHLI